MLRQINKQIAKNNPLDGYRVQPAMLDPSKSKEREATPSSTKRKGHSVGGSSGHSHRKQSAGRQYRI